MIPPYAVYSAETDAEVHSYELFFDIHPVIRQNEFLQQMGLDRLRIFPKMLRPGFFEELRDCYEAVQNHDGASYAGIQALLRLKLCDMARVSGSHPHSVSTPREQAVIDQLLMYLNSHMAEKFHTADACEVLSVSQSYLCRCANAVMGCSTAQLIARYKLMHARQLLLNPSMTISEAAAAIGYDVYYFSSQFKLHFGMSPSELRAAGKPVDAAVLI